MPKRHLLSASVAAAAITTAVFVAPATARVHAAACTAVSNVEAIVDDSGSMAVTDSNKLRSQAIKLIVESQAQNQPTFTFGAISFGTDVNTLFAPGPVGANKAAMEASLATIDADDGGTDYGAGFNKAAADNPNRQANIFMTDGANGGDPVPLPQPPTYVIGFGDSGSTPEDQAALQNIATATGGQYFQQTSSAKLVSVVNNILAQITCQTAPRTFNDTFTKVGQIKSHALNIGRTIHSLDMVISYPTADDQFSLAGISLFVKGKKVAASVAKKHRVKKLKVTVTRSETFMRVHVRGLKRGKLKFRVKATKLGVTLDPTNPAGAVTTQVTPRTSRK